MPDVLPGCVDQPFLQLHPQDVGGVKLPRDGQRDVAGATADIQHLLVPEPISFQETQTGVLLWPEPALPPIAVEAVVAIVTAVLAVLVAVLVLPPLWWLSRAHVEISTPDGGSGGVSLEET